MKYYYLILVLLVLLINNIYSFNINSNINPKNKKSINYICNKLAYNTTNNFILYDCILNNNCINKNNNIGLLEFIEYKNIYWNCIRKKQNEYIYNIFISFILIIISGMVIYII